MTTTFWTDQRLARLLELADPRLDLTHEEIGNDPEICATAAAVSSKLHRLGLTSERRALERARSRRRIQAGAQRMHARARERIEHVAPPASALPVAPDVLHEIAEHNMGLEVRFRPRDDLIPTIELQDQHCRYPIGDPRQPDFGHCGQERAPGGSYCTFHMSRCYDSPRVRRDHAAPREAAVAAA